MPTKHSEQPRRRSSRRSSSYGTGDDDGGGSEDYRLNSRRRHSDWEADLEHGHVRNSGLGPTRRDIYKPRSGPSSAARLGPIRRTYSRDDSTTRTVSDSSPSQRRRKVYNVVDLGMERRASASGVSGSRRSSIPYPSFSKAHSKESVAARENIFDPRLSHQTHETTDLTQGRTRSANPSPPKFSKTRTSWNATGEPPPSPPLTANGSYMRRAHSGGGIRSERDAPRRDVDNQSSNLDDLSSHDSALRFSASRISLRDAEEGRGSLNPSRQSSNAGPNSSRQGLSPWPVNEDKSQFIAAPPHTRKSPSQKRGTSQRLQSTSSDATSVLLEKKQTGRPPTLLSHGGASPPSDPESFPRTPNGHGSQYFTTERDRKETPPVDFFDAGVSKSESAGLTLPANSAGNLPLPPPPPPPLEVSATEVPKVDYLTPNGGLPWPIPKKFVSGASSQGQPQPYLQYTSPLPQTPRLADSQTPFASYQTLLDDMGRVLARNGSIAVATGYKSVARRLLERLEAVFARNTSSQICSCVMCKGGNQESGLRAADTGVSWGEVLELISGRRELPSWPPFSLPSSAVGLGLLTNDKKTPMQKLDIDVPEEYRDHYIRQSKKTKHAVDNWLASQPEDHTSPPTEVDDETLTFTMLTYLDPYQRPLFTALVRGLSTVPDSRAPTPAVKEPKTDIMMKVGTALERLYRLSKPPREAECSMYLLKNPSIHNALATLAAINDQEWEILVSGRFDGFLIAGAEHQFPTMGPIGSRGVTPFSRGPTPYRNNVSSHFSSASSTPLRNGNSSIANTPAKPQTSSVNTGTNSTSMSTRTITPDPVQLDEETEIAVLAEVEREIFLGMEALEDAFEALHVKAETVRRALRERGAGLSLQARAMGRRGSEKELDARLGTPFDGVAGISIAGTPASAWGVSAGQNSVSAIGMTGRLGGERDSDDDGVDDTASLAPNDSASNVGWKDRKNRHHRRRRPRRTPAPVDEMSE